jgi:hypothetical protein
MKFLTLTLFGIASFALIIAFSNLLLRRLKAAAQEEGKPNLSYIVLMASWLLSSALLNYNSVQVYIEFIDASYKLNSSNLIMDSLEAGILLIGSSCLWLLFSHYVAAVGLILVSGKRNDAYEIKGDNVSHFVFKGILMLVFIISSLPFFEFLLRFVLPTLNVPFYR